jgi:hypothetical protein
VREGITLAVNRALHLQFAVLSGDARGAKRMFAQNAADIFDVHGTSSKFDRYECLSVGFLYACYLSTCGTKTLALSLPSAIEWAGGKKSHDVAAQLTEYLRREAEMLADEFDARHGNDFYRNRLAKIPELLEQTSSYRESRKSRVGETSDKI